MKKANVIKYFGDGSVELAAQRLGYTRQAIDLWRTDEHDNIQSQLIRDRVLARGVRWEVEKARERGEPVPELQADLASTVSGIERVLA